MMPMAAVVLKFLYLTRYGRINRTQFWLGLIPLAVLYIIPPYLPTFQALLADLSFSQWVLVILTWLALTYVTWTLCLKRGYDIGRPNWYITWYFIARVAYWVIYVASWVLAVLMIGEWQHIAKDLILFLTGFLVDSALPIAAVLLPVWGFFLLVDLGFSPSKTDYRPHDEGMANP